MMMLRRPGAASPSSSLLPSSSPSSSPPMMLRLLLVLVVGLRSAAPVASQRHSIDGVPSPGNHIHVERDVVLTAARGTVVIDSAVPVTVQRYHDNYLLGQQPVTSNMAKVLVTSDCETSDASIVPIVSVSSDGAKISVDLETLAPDGEAVVPDDANAFLASSSYSAAWRWVSDFCNQFPPVLTAPTANAAAGTTVFPALFDDTAQPTKCQTGVAADLADMCQNPGDFCQLEVGACNAKSGIHHGKCVDTAEYGMCTFQYLPVCGCDGNDYANECAAYGAGVSVSRSGRCDAKPVPIATAAPLVDSGAPSSCRTETGIGAGDTCPSGYFCQLADGVCKDDNTLDLVGVLYDGVCAEIYDVCFDLYDPVCGCDGREYSNSCYAHSSGVSVSSSTSCLADVSNLEVEKGGDCPDENQCRDPQGVCQDRVNCVADPCTAGENPCSGNAERTEGVTCTANYCGGCHAVCASVDGEPLNAELAPPTTTTATDGTAAEIVVAKEQCDTGAPCSQQGSSCATGTETCCGQDFDSFRCTCEPGGQDGRLQYACFYTDACLLPPCCMSGLPAGMPPPTEDTCSNVGELCGTGVDDDYCCPDTQGAGTYCSETGGKASATTSTTAAMVTTDAVVTAAIVGPDMTMSAPTTIVTDPKSCDPFAPCSQEGSTCSKGTESCCGQTFPSMDCQCEDDGTGKLHYACAFTEACMVPPCCMNGPPVGTPPPSEGTCEVGEPCSDTGVEDDYCCFDMQGGAGTYCSLTGGKASETTSTTAVVITTQSESAETTGSPMEGATKLPSFAPTIGPSSGPRSGPTTSPNKQATTTTVATTAMGTSADGPSIAAATTVSSGATGATAKTSFVAIDGNFPTETPSARPSVPKGDEPTPSPNWWQLDGQVEGAPNSAFDRRPLSPSSCAMAAIVAVAVLAIIFPAAGDGGTTNLLWGLGKFSVAAAAVSSLYSSRSSSPGNVRRGRSQGGPNEQLFPARSDGRILQAATCRYNVEVLLDACSHSVEINAPAGRVVDVSVENRTSERDPEDDCATDYQATLTFPVTNALVLDLEADNTVEAFEGFDPQCMRPIAGRPFVDVMGGSLQAMPLVPDGERTMSFVSVQSWTGDASTEAMAGSRTGNGTATAHGRLLLGEDWTQRALGEHASVASFSAFSIALMTNRAPADLVDDALRAGLDEVRHARISFDIASRLTGKEVGPGPLPPSKHEFDQDLTALALAVAREGCVDETLSAFVAALEVEQITSALEKGFQDTLYSNVDRDTLTFIRDELITIAMDESNHSALAWRTLNWVCGVDPNACAAVHRIVFDETSLEMRFDQRADAPFGEKKPLLSEWYKIFNAHRFACFGLADEHVRESTCEGYGVVEFGADQADQPLLTLVTESVLRQMPCSQG